MRCLGERCLRRRQDFARMALQFLQIAASLEYEHAAIPGVATGSDVGARAFQVGLLDEALYAVRMPVTRQSFRALDVAVAGVRLAWLDAKRDEVAFAGPVGGGKHGCAKGMLVGDHMVRRQHQQNSVGVFLLHVQGGHRDGGCRASRHRFEQLRGRVHADLVKLVGNHETVLVVAEDHRRRAVSQAAYALDRLLQKAALPGEREELLRPRLS